jgi:hypothetical protein
MKTGFGNLDIKFIGFPIFGVILNIMGYEIE